MGQSKLATTPKSSTPFAGLVSFIAWLRQIGCYERIAQAMPFSYASPNAIPLADALCAFLVSVIRGAARCAHCDWLRFDSALHAMLGSVQIVGRGGRRVFVVVRERRGRGGADAARFVQFSLSRTGLQLTQS